MRALFVMLMVLSACAPAPASGEKTNVLLVAGGVVEGSWARLGSLQFALPGAPVVAAAKGDALFAAYPYQLLIYRGGVPEDSIPLSGVPRFIKVWPQLVVGLETTSPYGLSEASLFLPGKGTFPYAALDAVANHQGTYWLDGKALRFEDRVLEAGAFKWVVGDEDFVFAVSAKEMFSYPGSHRVSLPAEPQAVALAQDIYLLTKDGVYQLSRNGLMINFLKGSFTALAVDEKNVYLLENGRLVKATLSLERT